MANNLTEEEIHMFPQLHLSEETATVDELRSYLMGFLSLKGVTRGEFECGPTSNVRIVLGISREEYTVSVYTPLTGLERKFRILRRSIQVVFSRIPIPLDTVGFHAWYITFHLSVHLISCFREKEAA